MTTGRQIDEMRVRMKAVGRRRPSVSMKSTMAAPSTMTVMAVLAMMAFTIATTTTTTTATTTTSRRSNMALMFVDASAVVYSPGRNRQRLSPTPSHEQNQNQHHLIDRVWGRRSRRGLHNTANDLSFLGYDFVEEDDDDEDDMDNDSILPRDASYSTTASHVSSRNKAAVGDASELEPMVRFDDLGPIGKTVAGVTEVLFVTLLEYVQGFVTGWVFGTIFGSPGFFVKPLNPSIPLRQTPVWPELKGRFGRMNSRSVKWAKDWATISAVFSGFSVTVKVLRNGQEDVWNEILSSAAAGAFFARKEGPNAMLRGAIMYGGIIYMITGGIGKRGSQRPIQDYTESPLAILPIDPIQDEDVQMARTTRLFICDTIVQDFKSHSNYEERQQQMQGLFPLPTSCTTCQMYSYV